MGIRDRGVPYGGHENQNRRIKGVNVMDSPCHHCTKRPCYDHDTCEDYRNYRAALDQKRKENFKTSQCKDYVYRSIAKRKRKERYK